MGWIENISINMLRARSSLCLDTLLASLFSGSYHTSRTCKSLGRMFVQQNACLVLPIVQKRWCTTHSCTINHDQSPMIIRSKPHHGPHHFCAFLTVAQKTHQHHSSCASFHRFESWQRCLAQSCGATAVMPTGIVVEAALTLKLGTQRDRDFQYSGAESNGGG